MSEQRPQIPIAVVGVSALLPGSSDTHGAWRDILAGRDLITDVPPSHWLVEDYYDPNPAAPDKTYAKRGAFLSNVDFDPLEFGIPPSIVPATDTSQLLALIVAQRVLEDASQGQFAQMDREKMSVILGVTSGQELFGTMVARLQRPVWVKALRDSGLPEEEVQAACDRIAAQYVPWQESSFPGLLGNVVAGRIANRFDLRGTNTVTDAACASSLSALSMGVNELVLGQSDVVITGGVDTMNDIFMYMCFSKTPALSPTGDCRPFSDAADGTMLGEGLAMVALKRLADAERDGDRIYAVIQGVGSGSDGRSKSVYAPLPEGQARALRRAYETAGYGPETVELVEAHGTGTKAGDVAEFEGLRMVFDGSGRKDRQWCALGSIKSQIGHTKSTAGAAGLFKAVMALHHKVLPPTIKVERPNPKLGVEASPFYLNTQARPWIRDGSHPRRASVSAFGFGGSNFHVTLEEYGGRGKHGWKTRSTPTELVVLSGANGTALAAECRALASTDESLTAIARESQLAFNSAQPARLAVVASSREELVEKLKQAAALIAKAPETAFSTPNSIHYAHGATPGEVAFLFPGQGSQYVGMGADVAMAFDEARQAWDRAANLRFDGTALHEVVFPRPVFTDADREAQTKKLTSTDWAQPAIGIASLALLNVLRSAGVQATCTAGHSFGEITALHAAGALEEADFLRVARRRGELMRAASAIPGAMTAVARPIDEVRSLLAQWGSDVVVANHNSPTQVVLSGSTDAIAAVEKKLADSGITARRLPVATAFHSSLVAPSSGPFLDYLAGILVAAPAVDVYGNADASRYPVAADAIRERVASQLAQPVRFVDEIEAMYARGVRTFIEVGPGSVLTDLVGRILGDQPHHAVNVDRKGRHGVTSLQEGLGRLAVAGVALDFSKLWTAYAPPDRRPRKKPAMTIPLNGSNSGKPYPPPGGAKALPAPNPPRPVEKVVEKVVEVVAAPVAAAPVDASAQLAWMRAYQEAQRQTAEAHAAYQRAVADAHVAFLRTAEASMLSLSAMMSGQAPALPAPVVMAPPPIYAPPPPAATYAPPPPAPVRAAPAMTVVEAPPPAPVIARPAPAFDLSVLLMQVVAEKTGYPESMLGLQMELEADLGIDSIKRVEILSALREKAPSLSEIDPKDLATLRTLGQILDHMRARQPSAPAPKAAPVVSAPKAAPAANLDQLLLSVVAEKTGYPEGMLGLQMELEADLGIDSIKRVEILSALRETAPSLTEIDPKNLATLRTLGQILEHMRGAAPATAAPPSPPPTGDLEGLLRKVVADKTGYPEGMLALDMELEADLGIDSIKRVEILSALREQAPHLHEIDPKDLATLRTLGQITLHLQGQRAEGASPKAVAPIADPPRAIGRFAVREVPATPSGLAMAGLTKGGRVVVTDDGAGIAEAVVAQLEARDVNADVVTTVPADAEVVVFLGGLRNVSSVDEAVFVNREAFLAAKAVAPRFAESGGVFVGVQDTGGDFGLSGRDATRAWMGGIAGLVRTASREWPKASLKTIDCERGQRSVEEIAAVIVDELFNGAGLLEVGLHADGRRTTLASVAAPVQPSGERRITSSAVVLASGGARGVTASALIALARETKARIALLGRTPLEEEPAFARGVADEAGLKQAFLKAAQQRGERPSPSEMNAAIARVQAAREVRQTLAALKAAGSEARYIAADVQDATALARELENVRQSWGPITGIVHGAGVLADKRITDKTEEQFDRVFDTKIEGLRALLAATAQDPIEALCLFSSVAARTGNVGQSDYAMANEVLNLVACAEKARRRELIVRSIGWGPWEGGMVTPSLKAHFEKMNVTLIPLDVGARMFVEELTGSSPDTEIVIGGSAGGEALSAEEEHAVTAEVRVSARTHPELADHVVGAHPVVPVALVLEWFARAAQAARPDLVCRSIRDVKVLRGIKLEHFDNGGDRLLVRARQTSPTTLAVELRSSQDTLHYSATIELTEKLASAEQHAPLTGLGRWTRREAIYDGDVLFHGPRFQMLREVEGVSEDGLSVALVGLAEMDWPVHGWKTDPVLVDGGLQAALLWTEHVLGGASLPMAVGEYRRFHGAGEPELAVVRRRNIQGARAACDVAFLDFAGRVAAELLGVETVLRPGESARAVMPAVA